MSADGTARGLSYVGRAGDLARAIARSDAADWRVTFERRGYLVEYWQPRAPDAQEPHRQDEFYFVTAGRARIDIDGQVSEVAAGDVVFVAAEVPHRFFDQSDDLAMWIVFTGRP